MIMNIGTQRTSFVAMVVMVALLLGCTGMFHFGMDMQMMDGFMPGCPFMSGGAICSMSQLEHIAAWHSMFAAAFPFGKDMAALLLLLLASSLVLLAWRQLFTHDKGSPLHQWHRPLRQNPAIIDQLKEAFSNGILNPKSF